MDGHGERMSAIDASFLTLESPEAHMHVGWSAICSVPTGGVRPTVEALRTRVARRLQWAPRCRQRLLFAPLGLGDPRWVDDPEFDLAAHVVTLGDPDGAAVSPERFAELRDAFLSQPLVRTRPLWQIALVPRLTDGRLGLVGRVHHAMADGASALGVATLLLDVDGGGPAPAPESWAAEAAPSAARFALDPLLDGAEVATGAARGVAQAALRPRASVRAALSGARRVALSLSEDMLPRAPDSQLNLTLGPRRALTGYRAPLDELRAVNATGAGTLNDVGLAVVAGALRTLALDRGEPTEPLKAMIPVDVRGAHERGGLGNRVSAAAVWLPLQLGSAAARLAWVSAQTARFKRAQRPAGTEALLAGVGLLPSPLRGPVLRAGASPRAFNLTISNIPGPREALFMLGARVDEIYPVVPIAEKHALAIGMLSYEGQLHFGLHADPDALPNATDLPALLADEVAALSKPTRPTPHRRFQPMHATHHRRSNRGARAATHKAGRT